MTIITPQAERVLIDKGISIASGTDIGGGLLYEKCIRIYRSSSLHGVTFGAYSYLVQGILFDVRAGRYCSLAHGIEIGFHEHPLDWLTTHNFSYMPTMPDPIQWPFDMRHDFRSKHVEIGHDVWIGAHVNVMGGVNIGTGAVVATGSVVTKDVPPYAVMGGVPAKVIRYRFDDILIQRITESSWWDYDWPAMMRQGVAMSGWDDPHRKLDQIENERQAGRLDQYRLSSTPDLLFSDQTGALLIKHGHFDADIQNPA